MRKLALFGLLAGIFGLALALERFFSTRSPMPAAKAADNRAILQLGGGPPRSIPAEPPADPPPGTGGTRRDGEEGRGSRPRRDVEPAPAPLPVEAPARTHVVAKGETLSSIARQELGTSTKWKDLARWNGITDPSALKEGTPLRLQPAAATGTAASPPKELAPRSASARSATPGTESRSHRVAKGDTLSRIAARYLGDATRWREIQRLNAITDPASLSEGTTLKIPDR